MTTTVTLPEGFAYLAPAFMSTVVLALGQSITVGRYRKRANIPYPQMYAEKKEAEDSPDAHLFNCAQRAHQNTLELLPWVYTVTAITGAKYPVYASAVLGLWTLGRVSYTRGYVTGDPSKRGSGLLFRAGSIAILSSVLASAYISGKVLFDNLVVKLF